MCSLPEGTYDDLGGQPQPCFLTGSSAACALSVSFFVGLHRLFPCIGLSESIAGVRFVLGLGGMRYKEEEDEQQTVRTFQLMQLLCYPAIEWEPFDEDV